MAERNLTRYHLEQSDNKIYILSTSLINDKLKLSCQDSNSQTYFGAFSIYDLLKISKYFNSTRSVDKIQQYLNGIIEKQRVEIYQDSTCIKVILHLINNDKIAIPLTQKIVNNNDYYNISNQYIEQIPNITSTTNYSNTNYFTDPQLTQSYIYQQNSNHYLNSQSQIYSIDQNANGMSNIEIPGINMTINNNNNIVSNNIDQNQNILASSPVINTYPQADASTNFNYQMNKLENEINNIRPEQEKMTNELKRVLDQSEQYKQENDSYKQENALLSKDINNIKNENESLKDKINNIKNEIKEYQDQYESIKNEVINLQKNTLPLQEQNNELFNLKGNYENDMQIMQQNFEKISHDNDSLKSDLINLNKNLNLLTNQNETYAKEINELKIAFEKQQKPQYNEEEIKKLMEELNFYKIKAQENDLLAKQIEALKDQMQQLTQFQEQEQEEEEAKEVKGDIIHDMNELELLTKKINKDNKRLIINLLYKASADGDTASAFHEKCDEANNTIVLVETKDGKRFGGYTTCSWKGNCIEKADPDAFIFSFDKMKTYDNIPEDDAIGCYPKFGPIFLGCQIKIFDNAFTKGGTTFEKELNFDTKEDYELTGGNRTFEVKDIEVYEVVIEDLNN